MPEDEEDEVSLVSWFLMVGNQESGKSFDIFISSILRAYIFLCNRNVSTGKPTSNCRADTYGLRVWADDHQILRRITLPKPLQERKDAVKEGVLCSCTYGDVPPGANFLTPSISKY